MTSAAPRGLRVVDVLMRIATGLNSGASLPTKLCTRCLTRLPVSGVAVSLMTADGPSGVVLAATDDRARHLEELQFTLGEGPGVEASALGRPVLEPDLDTADLARWPGFGEAVLADDVHAVFAFPLHAGAVRVGVLDLYRDIGGELTPDELDEALVFADAATVVLLYLQEDAGTDGPQWAANGPSDGRTQVNQATGMVSIQLGVSLAEALLRMRAHAYAVDRTVAAVAADVVCRRTRFDESESGTTG